MVTKHAIRPTLDYVPAPANESLLERGRITTLCSFATAPLALAAAVRATEGTSPEEALSLAAAAFLAACLVLVATMQWVRDDYPWLALSMATSALLIVALA